MKIQLIAVGNKMPTWINIAYQEYARRLANIMPLELVEIPAEKRTKQIDIVRLLKKEGESMLNAVDKGNLIITLDIPGSPWSTPDLTQQIRQWKESGQNISLLIGGPEGLSPECKQIAQQSWSLSPLTLPHPMVRVIVAESLYRGWSITANHPYHRE